MKADFNNFIKQDIAAAELFESMKESQKDIEKEVIAVGGKVEYLHDEMIITLPTDVDMQRVTQNITKVGNAQNTLKGMYQPARRPSLLKGNIRVNKRGERI